MIAPFDQRKWPLLANLESSNVKMPQNAQWLGNPVAKMASLLVEQGCRAWAIGCQICCSRVIQASGDDGPVSTPFGLFAGPGDGKMAVEACSWLGRVHLAI